MDPFCGTGGILIEAGLIGCKVAGSDVNWKMKNGSAINLDYCGNQVTIEAPFVNWTKADVVKKGLELNVPYELTWSCYEGGDEPCGKCGTCIDRAAAFEMNGVKDPALKN
mgnify:CR=1 FL=1